MRHLLIVSFSDLSVDPRVNRQIRLLNQKFRVTAVGYADPGVPGVEFVRIPRIVMGVAGKMRAAAMLKSGLFERFYWSSAAVVGARGLLADRCFDLILANDVNTLPLALSLKSRRGVIFDAHEYSPREMEDDWKWRFFFRRYVNYLCEKYIPMVSGMVTVCEGIAEEYARNFGIKPAVVYNAPYRAILTPQPSADDAIRLVHHGAAIASRKIETMIAMMAHLDDRFSLDFYLVPTDPVYLERLQHMIAGHAGVRILPPVPMTQLPVVLNKYDVGVYILEPNNFNNERSLPNKFFEFIQGRIAVAIGPSPEMARLVRQYDCGIVAGDFSPRSLADRLHQLTPARLDYYKQQADEAADDLCYENASQVLLRALSAVTHSGY